MPSLPRPPLRARDVLAVVGLVAGPPALAAPCPDLDQALDLAEQAVVEGRLDDTATHLSSAEASLGCGPIATADQLARLWLTEGARLSLEGDPASASAAFAAAARVSPATWTAAYGDALQAKWQAAATEPPPDAGELSIQSHPDGLAAVVDGTHAAVPLSAPGGLYAVQLADESGTSRFGRLVYVPPGGSLVVEPGQLELGPDGPGASSTATSPAAPRRFPTFLVAGAASAVVGGAFAGLALTQGPAMDSAASVDELDATFGRQRAFGVTAYTAAGLAATGVVLHFAL